MSLLCFFINAFSEVRLKGVLLFAINLVEPKADCGPKRYPELLSSTGKHSQPATNVASLWALWPLNARATRVEHKIGFHLILLKCSGLFAGYTNYSAAFLVLSYSITPNPGKQINGHFEPLTATYEDGPACKLSCKPALHPEKQHSLLPKPWRDAGAGQHCVPSNATWPEVHLRLCKKGFSWNTTPYSAVK